MILRIRACGPGTSLQDGGRFGQMRVGLSRSGPMDRLALAQANILVGNRPDEGAIEFTLFGGSFKAEGGPVRLALAGAEMRATLDGAPCPGDRGFDLEPGQRLEIGAASRGVFAYLAVGGGLAVETALGSVSLQARATIGGLGGRTLRAGDVLPLRSQAASGAPLASLPAVPIEPGAPIRVVLGPQDDFFDEAAIAAFLSNTYRVGQEADRMGYRLDGPPIEHLHGYNIVSDGIVAGSIQVPGSGVPIVLMADHHTTGGYPKIATVASADLRILAQRKPGDPLRFAAIPIDEAEQIARGRAAEIAALSGRLVPLASGLPAVEALLGLNLAGAATDAMAREL